VSERETPTNAYAIRSATKITVHTFSAFIFHCVSLVIHKQPGPKCFMKKNNNNKKEPFTVKNVLCFWNFNLKL